jgi:hypothetical protein
MRIFEILGGAALLLVFSGCAVTLNLPVNRFDSPETRGELGRGHVEAAIEGAHELTIIPDVTGNPAQVNARTLERATGLRMGGELGLLDRLDVALKARSNTPMELEAKFQALGDPEKSAKEGNVALALSAAGGAGSSTKTGSDGFNGISGTAETDFTTAEFAAIGGYRPADSLLIYGGPFHALAHYSGTLTQTGTSTPRLLYSGTARQTGANAGLQWDGPRFSLKGEIAWSVATADASAKQVGFFSGILFALRW